MFNEPKRAGMIGRFIPSSDFRLQIRARAVATLNRSGEV